MNNEHFVREVIPDFIDAEVYGYVEAREDGREVDLVRVTCEDNGQTYRAETHIEEKHGPELAQRQVETLIRSIVERAVEDNTVELEGPE